jgi:hypothetical protein
MQHPSVAGRIYGFGGLCGVIIFGVWWMCVRVCVSLSVVAVGVSIVVRKRDYTSVSVRF